MRIAVVALAAGLLLGSTGCVGYYHAPVMPPQGGVYTKFEAPLDVDNDETRLGARKGMSSVRNVMGIVSWGDASTQAAAAQGDVEVIRHADYEFFNVLGFYSRFTTIVYGD